MRQDRRDYSVIFYSSNPNIYRFEFSFKDPEKKQPVKALNRFEILKLEPAQC